MKVTIRSVAEHAGVSPMTVSRVLNGRDRHQVAPATRARILESVRVLDYVPLSRPVTHHHKTKSHVLGLVFDQLDEVRDYVGAQLYIGLREGARHHGYDLLTILREGPDWAAERDEVRFLDGRSDGLIFVNPQHRQKLLTKLVQHKIPVVCCYGHDLPREIAKITLDEEHAMQLIINHLFELGHRRIGFIAGPQSAAERQQAFLKALRSVKLTVSDDHIFVGTQAESWRLDPAAINRAIAVAEQMNLTALVCANDFLAAGVLRQIDQQKTSPRLTVTGVDNVPVAERRGITTVHHPFAEVGRAAVEALVAMLAGSSADLVSHQCPAKLVVRKSTLFSTPNPRQGKNRL